MDYKAYKAFIVLQIKGSHTGFKAFPNKMGKKSSLFTYISKCLTLVDQSF